MRFDVGDRVRIDVDDEDDPLYWANGMEGVVDFAARDDLDELEGYDAADAELYRVDLHRHWDSLHVRGPDLEPAGEEGWTFSGRDA